MEFQVVIAIITFAFLFVLILSGIPIGFALGIMGFIGFWIIGSFEVALTQFMGVAWDYGNSWTIMCIPLFILMGQFVFYSGIAAELYQTLYIWFGRVPGGLAIATTFACALFGAVTGSSMAGAATMGAIAYPIMKKYNYIDELATGCLAASGTMGSMIPPSIIMIIYCVFTEQSIGRAFMAGILPGILSAFLYAIMIFSLVSFKPSYAPKSPVFNLREKLQSLKLPGIWIVVFLMLLILGGIYGGIFSPTEAAGMGSFFAFFVPFILKRMSYKNFILALQSSLKITAMILVIIFGAILFSRFFALSGISGAVVNAIISIPANRYVILGLILVMYLVLGTALDLIGQIALTMPVVFPAIVELGFDPIWFAVIIVKMMEMALITPPHGANVFVIGGIAPEVPMTTIFRGIVPFLMMDIITLIILIIFPSISLFIPNIMF